MDTAHLTRALRAPNTHRGYEYAWRQFRAWCGTSARDPGPPLAHLQPERLGQIVQELATLRRYFRRRDVFRSNACGLLDL